MRKGPPLGAHVSVAGGVHTAPERGKRIGADVVQIFSKHNTLWAGKALEPDDARALREECGRTGVAVAAVHCAYLINLGSSKETVRPVRASRTPSTGAVREPGDAQAARAAAAARARSVGGRGLMAAI